MSSKAGKRPLRSLTAHEKLEAIRRVHDGESKASVARDIGVPESTLRGWCKNEDKISYLSRQSSPETDEDPKEKRPKLEEMLQPYNLSKKAEGGDFDAAAKPLNLNVKTEGFKTNERERNRAELARLSVELGLNRPEMFLPGVNNSSGGTMADLGSNMMLLTQYNLLMQQQQQQKGPAKVTAPADTSTSFPKLEEPKQKSPKVAPKAEKPLDEAWYWLKLQNQNQNGLPTISSTSTTTTVTSSCNNAVYEPAGAEANGFCFWDWYKTASKFFLLQQQQQQTPDRPILYQQLTKDKDEENIIAEEKPAVKNTKARAVLDNLLFNNNNLAKRDAKDEVLSQNEALEHGEKFLEWLECCGEPSVTAVQIMQFRYLLNNIKNGSDRRNGDLQNRAKVKRK